MADDVASLGFAIDSAPLVRSTNDMKALSAEAAKLQVSTDNVSKSTSLAATSTQRLAREQQLAIAVNRASIVAQAELGDKIELLGRRTDQAYQTLSTRSFFRLLAREASLVGGPLGGVISQFGILNVGGQRLGVGLTAATIGFSALAATVALAVGKLIEFENQQGKTSGALILTGNASGQTRDSLEKMARSLAESGTVSLTAVREAQIELLKFRNIGGDAFQTVLEISKRAASSGLTDMKGAVEAIGKALKDIPNATDALASANLKLSTETQKSANAFFEQGNRAAAMKVILDELAKNTLGADAQSANTLSASFNRLVNTGFLEWIAQTILPINGAKMAMDGLTIAIKAGQDVLKGTAPLRITVGGTQGDPQAANQKALADAAEKVRLALSEQGKTAGMTALQLAQYNETVAKGIPANTAEAAAIRQMVAANMSANEFRQTLDGLKQQSAATQIQAKTVGMSAGAAAEYTVKETARQNAIIKGLPLTAAQNKLVGEQAQKIGAATQAAAEKAAVDNANFDRQTMFLSDTEKQIADVQRSLHGNEWQKFSDDGLSAVLRINGALKDLKTMGFDFSNTFVQGLLSGKTAMDALVASADNLAKSLAQQGQKDILSGITTGLATGNFMGAAVGAAEVGVSFLIGKMQAQSKAKVVSVNLTETQPANDNTKESKDDRGERRLPAAA